MDRHNLYLVRFVSFCGVTIIIDAPSLQGDTSLGKTCCHIFKATLSGLTAQCCLLRSIVLEP